MNEVTNSGSSLASSSDTVQRRSPKSKSVKLNARGWLLTFPRCELDKETAMENLLKHFDKDPRGREHVQFARVGSEKHKDGTPHLHVFIYFAKAHQTRRCDYFDFVGGQHGSYETARINYACYTYAGKDGDFVDHGTAPKEVTTKPSGKRSNRGDETPAEEGAPKKGKFAKYAEAIVAGATIEELTAEDPGFVMNNLGKIKAFEAHMKNIANRVVKEVHPGLIKYNGTHEPTAKVVAWFNDNLFCDSRELKKPQLYLWGPGNSLKTTVVRSISKYFETYEVPNDMNWYNEYSNKVKLAVFDEFEGKKTIPFMNTWLQGSTPQHPMTLPVHCGYYAKTTNPATVILSNYPPHGVPGYKGQSTDTFELRLTVVHTMGPLDINNIEHVPRPDAQNDHDRSSDSSGDNGETASSQDSGAPSDSIDLTVDEDDPKEGRLTSNDCTSLAVEGAGGLPPRFLAWQRSSRVAEALVELRDDDSRGEWQRLKGKEPESEPDDDTLLPTPTNSQEDEQDENEYQERHNRFIAQVEEDE